MPGGDRGRHIGVIAGQDQHAAVFGRAMPVALPHGIQTPVHPGALAVPHAEDAIVVGVVVIMNLLRTPQGCCRQVFIEAGPEFDVMSLQVLFGAPQLLVDGRHGRAAITGNKTCRIQSGGKVPAPLRQQQPHNSLGAGKVYPALVQGIFVIQLDSGQRHCSVNFQFGLDLYRDPERQLSHADCRAGG